MNHAKSWIEVAPESHFPLQNLPLGRMLLADWVDTPCTRIGDWVIDVTALYENDLLIGDDPPASWEEIVLLNGVEGIRQVRQEIFDLFLSDNPLLRDDKESQALVMRRIEDTELTLPFDVEAFVDFYSGINHASNVGRMFRPDMPPLLPNYRHIPVGYNGRSSTVIVSGESVTRPNGQTKSADAENPTFGPSRELDFELELGFFVGNENEMGQPVLIDHAPSMMLGAVLVNDWSARDIQRWEYQPLGPFLAKSFATSISPWIVTFDALEPFRVPGPDQDPEVLPYLKGENHFHFNIELEVTLQTTKMTRPQVICRTNARELYWNFAQQLTHQASNGTQLRMGDLYASGTISGTEPGTFGSLLELTWRGRDKIVMDETGEERTFLEDGDTLTLTGWAQGDGYRVGFGEVTARINPAPQYP